MRTKLTGLKREKGILDRKTSKLAQQIDKLGRRVLAVEVNPKILTHKTVMCGDKCPACRHPWGSHTHLFSNSKGCNVIKIHRGDYVNGEWHPGASCDCLKTPPEGVEIDTSDTEWED